MKTMPLLAPSLLILLAACTSPTDDTSVSTPEAAPAAASADAAPTSTTSASTRGVVESVDPAARTVTIAHEPVPALQWPAMTMNFKAPDADLSALKPGDRVSFEFTSSGMDGTITMIETE